MSIKIFLCKEEKLDLTNTWNKHVVLFASRHPPPVTRFQLVPAFFDTRDTLTPNFFYSPYSVLCTLSSTYNKSQRMSMYFYKPDMRLSFKNTLLAMISIILLQVVNVTLHKKKMRKHVHSTVPAGCPGAPSPAETTFSCLFGEVVRIAWFHLSIFNTKEGGPCRHEELVTELRTTEGWWCPCQYGNWKTPHGFHLLHES